MNTGEDCGPGAYRNDSDLSEEDKLALKEEREAFRKATADLRNGIQEKRRALRDELTKENTDAKHARKLQKELSGLEAELDLKRIDHLIKMKGISPDFGRSFAMKSGGEFNRSHHGPCWQ